MRTCKVDPVQSVSHGHEFFGWGFVIRDDTNRPRLTLCYSKQTDAEAARVHVAAALANAMVGDS